MPKPKAHRRPRPAGWLTTEQLAVKLDRSTTTIENMVADGLLPPPYQWGNKCVLYREDELTVHLAQQGAEKIAAAAAANAIGAYRA